MICHLQFDWAIFNTRFNFGEFSELSKLKKATKLEIKQENSFSTPCLASGKMDSKMMISAGQMKMYQFAISIVCALLAKRVLIGTFKSFSLELL